MSNKEHNSAFIYPFYNTLMKGGYIICIIRALYNNPAIEYLFTNTEVYVYVNCIFIYGYFYKMLNLTPVSWKNNDENTAKC